MAKGTEEKQSVLTKLKEIYPDAFMDDKVLRIPINDVQIKVALTVAKENIEPGGNVVLVSKVGNIAEGPAPTFGEADTEKIKAPSQDELNAVNSLFDFLGI